MARERPPATSFWRLGLPLATPFRMFSAYRWIAMAAAGCLVTACLGVAAPPKPLPANERLTEAPKVVEPIYAGGLQGDWQDYGWTNRDTAPKGPERMELSGYGGWILVNTHLKTVFGGLVFRVRAPAAWADFLEVRLDSTKADIFPRVRVRAAHRRALADGWVEVYLPAAELNPVQAPFDRVVLRAIRSVPARPFVELEGVGLTELSHSAQAEAAVVATPADFEVDCAGASHQISPLIYGIAFSPLREYESAHQWQLGATARRWGGNPSSRYNWELGNAWNAGADYFFRNLNYTRREDFTWATFLSTQQEHQVQTALTVPLVGWVARDVTSFSFPVSEFGAQQHADPDVKNAGNGFSRAGKPLEPSAPTRTSVAAPPEFIEAWVRAIRNRELKGVRTVNQYILDNEPMLWHDTQRDVHPSLASYDELLAKTIAYGSAVRRADPDAQIAGPAEWGWPGYLWSAVDAKAGFAARPDRRAHGDVPLVPWYLKQLADHERKTGVRVLDVLDLHFYPQGKNLGVGQDGAVDAETNARRLRSTRSLWDPTYVDESWISEKIQLIPRMREWVAQNDPGLKLSIGEYNFGAERHPSGGLALAEALGRFGEQDLYSAFYWTYPAEGTPAFWAFRAFRNYDGKGAHFLDWSLPTTGRANASLFASRNAEGTAMTLVLLNLSPETSLDSTVLFKGCPAIDHQRVFGWAGDPRGFTEKQSPSAKAWRLPPYSITVVELSLLPLRPPPKAAPGAN
jgi:hypothetical protein